MNKELIRELQREKLIVIVRGCPADRLIPLAQAMYDGGIRFLEITYSADGRVSDEETAQHIRQLVTRFEGQLYIGAGTVLSERQVALTRQAGGRFIISPNTDPQVIRATVQSGLVSIPGALSPSEIQLAHQSGADFVKLFPAVNLGPDYIKAVAAPLCHIPLLAVGGIHEENLAAYLKAGVCGFGIGSNIVSKSLIEAGDYAGITRLAAAYVRAVKEAGV